MRTPSSRLLDPFAWKEYVQLIHLKGGLRVCSFVSLLIISLLCHYRKKLYTWQRDFTPGLSALIVNLSWIPQPLCYCSFQETEIGGVSSRYATCHDCLLTVSVEWHRYVGNTMATFVMQSLGCEVAALNTVHFSEIPYFCTFFPFYYVP